VVVVVGGREADEVRLRAKDGATMLYQSLGQFAQ
jgi:hypothetical protein